MEKEKLFEEIEGWTLCNPALRRKFIITLLSDFIQHDSLSIEEQKFIHSLLKKLNLIHIDVISQKIDAISEVNNIIREVPPKHQEVILNIFEKTITKLQHANTSWDYEMDIEPIQRFLIIQDKISIDFCSNLKALNKDRYNRLSDIEYRIIDAEYNSFLKEIESPNLLSVGISYSYANINLPKTYDIIFDCGNLDRFWEQKSVVKYAFNFRTLFHTDLWRGHHSHCFIEILGEIPNIFEELPNNDGGKTLHKGIGLCTKYDWQYIRKYSYLAKK